MRRLSLPLCLVPLALVGVIVGLAVSQPATGGRKFALLVGVKDYSDSDGELGNLNQTENDVNDLEAFLKDKAGYVRVVVLTQTRGNSNRVFDPTADRIKKHLDSLLEDARKGDTVLVAFSGHGLLKEVNGKEESFFCPMDARPKQNKNLVALDEVYRKLDACKADVKVLLADACRNDPTGKGGGGGQFDPVEPPKGVVALYSCGKGQKSYESGKAKRGFFFDAVLKGLGGAAANRQDEVTLLSLTDYVAGEVPVRVKEEVSPFVRQTPSLAAARELSGKVVLATVAAKPTPPTPRPRPTPMGDENTLRMKFVTVPKGTFWKGGEGGKPGEKLVAVEEFQIGIHEVTQGQWQALMGSNPSWFSRGGESKDRVKEIKDAELAQFPVENVSWDDAKAFIKKLNETERDAGWVYRLPTEAEWEYACRGGATSREDCSYSFYFDDKPTNDLSSDRANFDGRHPAGAAPKGRYLARTEKVGSYRPNKLGIYDMHGNVWEWCEDLWGGGPNRVIRGGSWFYDGPFCRASYYLNSAPADHRLDERGFRLARSPSR